MVECEELRKAPLLENHTSIDRWSSKAYDHEVFGTGSQ